MYCIVKVSIRNLMRVDEYDWIQKQNGLQRDNTIQDGMGQCGMKLWTQAHLQRELLKMLIERWKR